MNKRIKAVIGFIVSFILAFGCFLSTGHAETKTIHISIDEGFNGRVKMGEGFPLSIKFENKGEAFAGDLLINFNPSWNIGGALSVQVDLPPNSTKTYQVSLPGITDNYASSYQNVPAIQLFKGDWRKGENIKFSGDDKIKTKFLDMDETVIGVLSENYDRLKELRVLPFTQIQMLELKKEQLPKQALGLEMIDYLVIDEYPLSQLDKDQQFAIKEWIERGGTLIAGGSPSGSQSYGEIYSLLPMQMENEKKVSSSFLNQINSANNPGFYEVNVFTGKLQKDAIIIDGNESMPFTAKSKVGEGAILQTGFSLGDEPISGWKGYSTWFADFINKAEKNNAFSGRYGPDFYGSLYWEFVEANEFFPASQFSIAQLIALLGGYIILIVPILYLVLRKIDKREHSWWIIPSLAVLMGAVVFGIGAKDRISQPQLNQMGIYKASEGQLSGLQASTLLSNKSGEYTLSIPKEFKAVPGAQNMKGFDPLRSTVYEEKRKYTDVVFPKVDYWSSKTIYGKASQKTGGSFITKLTLKNNQLTGSIQNGFPYDFEEVFIWSGNEKIPLGSLKKGETIQVNKGTKQAFLTKPTSPSGLNYSYQTKDINKVRRERLQYAASNYILNNNTENEPIIAGYTKNPILDVKMTGKKEKQENTSLILESFLAEQEFSGPFSIKNDMMSYQFQVIRGHVFEKMINGSNQEMAIDDGEYDYIVQLPNQLIGKTIKLDELTIKKINQMIQYSIYNYEKNEWMPIDLDKKGLTLNKETNIQQYVSNKGEITLKLLKNAKGDQYVQLPAITIKGEVAP
ncbi:hypothetical protein [Bacillus sp. S/N-304-OC-R1]|uniref:hypothetical protein n=1 Tax=Bacillus sp. S/N-304-OC-R1 TaxID=2758034 RepID=UPI001C8E780A|nr:hypothetical protein [Bacillus sp. S/N-304-OC-R1]MBY0120728.1 hypothetical protein [Bacillus sp. S/N-304-OC-R1]